MIECVELFALCVFAVYMFRFCGCVGSGLYIYKHICVFVCVFVCEKELCVSLLPLFVLSRYCCLCVFCLFLFYVTVCYCEGCV